MKYFCRRQIDAMTTHRDFHDNLLKPAEKIIDALRIIDGHGVPIGLVHENGRLLGTVTDGDIRRGLLVSISLEDSVSKVMNASPISVPPGTNDAAVRRLMQERSILFVPVVDDQGHVVDLKVHKDMLLDADVELAADTSSEPESNEALENVVVIMAGGEGRRLRPLTENKPKPMVEVGGRPILETIVERFVRQGFRQLYISVNYRREVIEDYFGDGDKWGARITYIREEQALGTAGALGLLPERPKLPFIVMNGDLITRVDFRHMLAFHHEHNTPATMAVSETRFDVPYGVATAEGTALVALEEKPIKSFFVNAGVYVLSPEMLDLIFRNQFTNITDLFATQVTQAKTGGAAPAVFPLREYWIDVGNLEHLEYARRDSRNLIREV